MSRKYNQSHVNWINSNKKDFLDINSGDYDYITMAEALSAKFNLMPDTDLEVPDHIINIVKEIIENANS